MDVFVSGPSPLHVSVGGSVVDFSPASVGDLDWIPSQCIAMLNIAVGCSPLVVSPHALVEAVVLYPQLRWLFKLILINCLDVSAGACIDILK